MLVRSPLSLPLAQYQSESMHIRRHNRKRPGARKSLLAVRPHSIQSAVLQVVDR